MAILLAELTDTEIGDFFDNFMKLDAPSCATVPAGHPDRRIDQKQETRADPCGSSSRYRQCAGILSAAE